MLSIMCILIEILRRVHTKGANKSLNSFKLGDFKVRFLSDGAPSMAVKGLICTFQALARLSRVSSRLVGEISRPLVCFCDGVGGAGGGGDGGGGGC